MQELHVKLTDAEYGMLIRRDTRYRSERGRVVSEDHGPTLDWPHGVRKPKARQSAEAKVLAALGVEA